MNEKTKIVAVVGVTASGKTSLAIDIAQKCNGEVISADSRQVYRELDIGTGKVTEAEMAGVPHHLIDVAEPTEVYTASNFVHDAAAVITRIKNRDHLPIIAGGTFFYLDLLRGKQQASPVPPNEAFRASIADLSNITLHERLYTLDPRRAAQIDPHNRRRLIRALEIIDTLGKVPERTKTESPYNWLIIGLTLPKERLLEKFRNRITDWLTRGFQAEVEQLLATGVTRERLSELGFEYTLMLSHLDGHLTEDELKERFVQKNWQYAKRQLTWLKRDGEIKWYAPEDCSAIFRSINTFLHPKE